MREYARELRDMRDRVRERPYLFEQVKQVSGTAEWLLRSAGGEILENHVCFCFFCLQKNARAQAEQVFRNKLKKNGITERFIQQHGGGNEESSSSRSNDNAHESDSGSSRYAKWEKQLHVLHVMPQTLGKLWIALVMESQGLYVVWSYYIT